MAKHGALAKSFTLASQLRPLHTEPGFPPLPVPGLKSLLEKGLLPGTITQIQGTRSSGRTALGAHILAQATSRGEICAIVDTQNNLNPESLHAAGIRLDHLVWIRCNGNTSQAMRAVDLLLHAGGFGLVWLDLCEVAPVLLQRIPLSYWFRFQRAIENTSTILVVGSDFSCAKSSSINNLCLKTNVIDWFAHQGGVCLVKTAATLQKKTQTQLLLLQAVV